jgi:hypothetical protein
VPPARGGGTGGPRRGRAAQPPPPNPPNPPRPRPAQAWTAQGKRGVWLKVPLSKAHLVGPAAAPLAPCSGAAGAAAANGNVSDSSPAANGANGTTSSPAANATTGGGPAANGASSSGDAANSTCSGGGGGFVFHHAEADYVMMTRWLAAGVPSTLPPNASHQVGVGAFVINARNEVLVVQEALGPLKGKKVRPPRGEGRRRQRAARRAAAAGRRGPQRRAC